MQVENSSVSNAARACLQSVSGNIKTQNLNYNLHKLNFEETIDDFCDNIRPLIAPAFRMNLYALFVELIIDSTKEFNLSVDINENIIIITPKPENVVDLHAISIIIKSNTLETLKDLYKDLCVKHNLEFSEQIYLSNLLAARRIMKLNATIIDGSISVNIPQY